jgi:hypothetical protein
LYWKKYLNVWGSLIEFFHCEGFPSITPLIFTDPTRCRSNISVDRDRGGDPFTHDCQRRGNAG